MVTTRSNQGMSEEQIREFVAEEVNRAFNSMIPELLNGVRDQFTALLDERLATVTATGGGPSRGFTYRDFSACAPPEFKGELDPTMALRWVSDMEGVFHTCGCPDNLKVRYALNLLRGPAKDWWKLQAADMTEEQQGALLWGEFVERFRRQYVSRVEIERITRDFLSYRQKNESVTKLTIKFREMALFCPEYTSNEDMKMERFAGMLKDEIREFVRAVPHTSLSQMIESARRREIELEYQAGNKWAPPVQSATTSQAKRPRTSDARTNQGGGGNSRGHQGGSGRQPMTCFKCGQPGHLMRDCKEGLRLCFNCGQGGHLKNECPKLMTGGGGGGNVRAPAPSTLRITDGRTGAAEEAQAAPKVVTGTFIVNSMPTLVLFDSGATHSFVSLSFCALWDRDLEKLDHVLIVDVADGSTVAVSDVYRGCIMEFSGTKFVIDLIPIAIKELCVLVGMDWLESVGAKIDCRYKQVWVRTPSGGELIIQGNIARYGTALRMAARAQKYLQPWK